MRIIVILQIYSDIYHIIDVKNRMPIRIDIERKSGKIEQVNGAIESDNGNVQIQMTKHPTKKEFVKRNLIVARSHVFGDCCIVF